MSVAHKTRATFVLAKVLEGYMQGKDELLHTHHISISVNEIEEVRVLSKESIYVQLCVQADPILQQNLQSV